MIVSEDKVYFLCALQSMKWDTHSFWFITDSVEHIKHPVI